MPLAGDERDRLGCRPGDRIDRALIADASDPGTFTHDGERHPNRAYKTTRNTVTAWWDASQLYGYDTDSRRRVHRDPGDPARLTMTQVAAVEGNGDRREYLPPFAAGDPIAAQWSGQEATAFPDNWTVGLSFFHNLFAREHNAFVDAFRREAARTPDADCGLRNPARPDAVVRYRDVTPSELFEIARLVVAAEIAKIHTTEWTPQLLYDEPLHRAANANWGGLLDRDDAVSAVLENIVVRNFGASDNARRATAWYSVFASGPGIFGLGNHVYPDALAAMRRTPDLWSIANPGSRQRRRQSLRLAVQLSGRVRHGVPAARTRARLDRVPRVEPRPEHDPAPHSRREDRRRRSDARDARARHGELGTVARTPARRQARVAQPAPIPAEPSAAAAAERDGQGGRRGTRHHSRPRAGRSALQRVPTAIRFAATAVLRRFHRYAPAARLARTGRTGTQRRDVARPLRPGTVATHRKSSHRRSSTTPASRSATASDFPTARRSTTSRTSTPSSAGSRSRAVRTVRRSPRPSCRYSFSTRHGVFSAIVFSRPASDPSSTRRSASGG
jgi:hypothetical protein